MGLWVRHVNWYVNVNTVSNAIGIDWEVKDDVKQISGCSPKMMESDALLRDTLTGLEDSKAAIERI